LTVWTVEVHCPLIESTLTLAGLGMPDVVSRSPWLEGMKEYRYCLICGAPLQVVIVEDKEREYCPSWDFVDYRNPLPVAVAVAARDKGFFADQERDSDQERCLGPSLGLHWNWRDIGRCLFQGTEGGSGVIWRHSEAD
jgi:hypothetical protein